MRWEGQDQSDNVEDRRDGGGGGGGFGGFGGGSIGIGTIVVALLGGWVFGVNPLTVLSLLTGGDGPSARQQQQAPAHPPPADDRQAAFVSTILRSTEDTWSQVFRASGTSYQPPRLVLFRGATRTGCGQGEAAMGPFYCPADARVYIDLDFFDTLKNRLGAPGDFAQAYVIAHEVGHHVQNLQGVTGKVDGMRGRLSQAQGNALSVRVELQADCYAGIWARNSEQSRHWLDQGDVEEALNAASQIGDDTLQRHARGTVVPESFTHGSSAQRVGWFKRGFDSGRVADCNTFESRAP